MSLKQSCFKSIVKSDIKRAWWISAIFTLFMFLTVTTPLIEPDYFYVRHYSETLDFVEETFANHVFGMGLAAFLVLYLFSYINKVNSVSFFHGLPIKRESLLAAHLTSASILLISPMLINSLISLAALAEGIKISNIAVSLGLYLVYTFAVLSVTLFISMLCGISVAGGIFTVIFILLPLYILAFVVELCDTYLYGFSSSNTVFDFLVEYVYLSPEEILGPKVLIYIALSLVFIGLAFFIYKKRNLENYGEVIAFPNLKGLFKVLFGICAGALGYYYFVGFWNITNILTMLVFGTLGVVVAHMISNKSVSLKGVLRPIGVTAVIVLVIYSVFAFDLFGFETRIPDADDVESVEIVGLYYDDYRYTEDKLGNSVKVKRKDPYVPLFTSKEDIQLFLDLHSREIANRASNETERSAVYSSLTTSYYGGWRNFTFKYTLKNGQELERSYQLYDYDTNEYLDKIYSTDVYRKWEYPILDGTEKRYTYLYVTDYRLANENSVSVISAVSPEATKFIDAIIMDRKDFTAADAARKRYNNGIRVEVAYDVPYVDEAGKVYYIEDSEYYYIDSNDVHTLEVLKELKLFGDEKVLEPSDVERVVVGIEEYVKDGSLYDIYGNYGKYAEEKAVATVQHVFEGKEYTDEESIKALFDMFFNTPNDAVTLNDDYVILNVELDCGAYGYRNRTVTLLLDNLPDILSDLKNIQ